MSNDDETLTELYTQRQDVLKQLAEIDNQIKHLEAKIKAQASSSKLAIEETPSDDADVNKVNAVIVRCTQDAGGVRDAIKMAEACRYIQDSFRTDDVARQKLHFRDVFAHECIVKSVELACDGNGSELMQHVVPLLTSGSVTARREGFTFELAAEHDQSELISLIQHMGTDITAVACNTNGARVAQKIVDSLTTIEEFTEFARVISDDVVALAKDINGNHTLSKLMSAGRLKRIGEETESASEKEQLTSVYRMIYETIAAHCTDICRNRQGCCIIQKSLQVAPEPYYSTIFKAVLNNTLKLVQDPFGNYVVQFILDRQQELNSQRQPDEAEGDAQRYTNQVIRQMLHHVAELSCNKFSSNVIEKCLKTASPDVRQLLVDELTEPQVLPKLLTDSYANYVIQTAIATASDDGQFNQLRDSIIPLQSLLKNSPYGVKIEAKLLRRHKEATKRQAKKRDQQQQQHQQQQQQQQQQTSVPPMHQRQDNMGAMNAAYISGMPTLQMLPPGTSSREGLGPQMTFTNVAPDMASFLQQQQLMNMPFVLQGQQVIGLPGGQPPPQFTTMNMLGAPNVPPDYIPYQ